MTAAERLDRARELIEQAGQEIDEAIEIAEPHYIEAMRFLKSELTVTRRRLLNSARVIGGRAT